MSPTIDPSRLAGVRALVVGDLLADHYVFGQTERVSREAPVLIVRHESEEVKLGGGANAAANARALGARVLAVGVAGRDEVGQRLAGLFRHHGISARLVRDGVVTETRTRILAGGLSTTRQQMLRLDRGATPPLPPRVRRALAARVRSALGSVDVVVVSDYGAGVVGEEVRTVLERARVPVCVDSRFALSRYRGFTVLKPNEPELAALAGLPVSTDAEVLAAGKAAMDACRCEVLLVTRGRKGMALFQAGARPVLIPVFGNEEAVDVTGAGDTVGATFAVGLGAGLSPREAADLANVAGALVVQKQGTATVTAGELQRALGRSR